jgi:hypothetical protein
VKVLKTIVLVETDCAVCDVVFAVPTSLQTTLKQTGERFFCPRGHGLSYADNEVTQLRKQVDGLRTKLVHAEDQRQATVRELQQARADADRQRKRVAAGVCPCCKRTFANVARHMKGQHPEFGMTREEA